MRKSTKENEHADQHGLARGGLIEHCRYVRYDKPLERGGGMLKDDGLVISGLTFQPGSLPTWGTFIILMSLVATLWMKNRKLTIDGDAGLRDHYATEVAGLRAQVIAVQQSANMSAAAAEERYNLAIEAADQRHQTCERECDRLRDRVAAMERKFAQLHQSTLRMFEPRADLPEETKQHMRTLEQLAAPERD